jgi:hypothetical protein
MGIMNIQCLLGRKQYGPGTIEAYHIHNLPSLIEDFSYSRLSYYLDIEAVQYLKDMGELVSEDYKKTLNFLAVYKKEEKPIGADSSDPEKNE